MTEKGKYIYCIIQCDGEREFAVNGIDGERVYTINEGDLAAVVSDLSTSKYSITPGNIRAHELVIEEVMKDFTVLPMGFSYVAKDAQQIKERVLKAKFDRLHRLLSEMDNKVELGVKALWQEERIYAEIADSNPRIRRLRRKIANKPPDTTREEQTELGRLVQAALSKRREREAKEMLTPLESLAVDKRLNKIMSPTMIFNASFLVNKDREPEFDKAVNELDERYGGEIKFIYAGPLPPYDFVDMAIRL